MSPASFPVLGLAAVVSSPALYNGLVTGALAFDEMLIRYLVAVAVVWAALSLVSMLVGSAPAQTAPAPGSDEPEQDLPRAA